MNQDSRKTLLFSLVLLLGSTDGWSSTMKLREKYAKFFCETSTAERMKPMIDQKMALMPRAAPPESMQAEFAKIDGLWAQIQGGILQDLKTHGLSKKDFKTLGTDSDQIYEFSSAVKTLVLKRCPRKFPDEMKTAMTLDELTERLAKPK